MHISLPNVSIDHLTDFLESLYLGAIPTDFHSFLEHKELSELLGLFLNEEDLIRNKPQMAAVEAARPLISDAEDKTENLNFVKTDDIEVFVMKENAENNTVQYEYEDVELRSLVPKEVNGMKSLQFQSCNLCGENAIGQISR